MDKSMSRLFYEDSFKGMEYLANTYCECIDVVITSPPYANQRANQYGGIDERDYPEWTVRWMELVKLILKPHGSVFINIRPHIRRGEISDYVLKTRLALREAGWVECEELQWLKPDSPPLGSTRRPRRSWEHILWFSKSGNPFCDPKAGGDVSNRLGFENTKFEHGGKSHIHGGQNRPSSGIARVRDVIVAGTSKVEKGEYLTHPAMFPIEVPDYCIKLSCPKNGIVLDPFSGSGTTLRAAVKNDRGFIGFENNKEYVKMAEKATISYILDNKKEDIYPDFIEVNGSEDE